MDSTRKPGDAPFSAPIPECRGDGFHGAGQGIHPDLNNTGIVVNNTGIVGRV